MTFMWGSWCGICWRPGSLPRPKGEGEQGWFGGLFILLLRAQYGLMSSPISKKVVNDVDNSNVTGEYYSNTSKS